MISFKIKADIVIIEREDNIILNTKWRNKGYVNLKLLEKSTQRFLQNNIINHLIYKINNLFKSVNIKKSDFIQYKKEWTKSILSEVEINSFASQISKKWCGLVKVIEKN